MGIVEKLNQMADAMNKAPTPEHKNRLFNLAKDYLKWRTEKMKKDPAHKAFLEQSLKAILADPRFEETQKKIFRRD